MRSARSTAAIGLLVAAVLGWATSPGLRAAAKAAAAGAPQGRTASSQAGKAGTSCVVDGKTYQNCTRGMLKQAARQAAARTRGAQRSARTAGAGAQTVGVAALAAPAPSGLAPLAPTTLGLTAGNPDYFGTTPNYANSPLPMGGIGSIVPVFGGSGYTAPTVTITDAYGSGTGATATAVFAAGGPITGFTISNPGTGYLAPIVTVTDGTGAGLNARAVLTNIVAGTGLRKFVSTDALPIPPVATPTACTYSGQAADCYEIWEVEYSQPLHADLPATKLRGYAQIYPIGSSTYAPNNPSYLGPIIVAQRNKPVRITFRNMLPVGAGGDLFIPVDTTYMGAGTGPNGVDSFTQNRTSVHLHGATTPWISDGTPHQWITPASETTPYPKGVSVKNVPDMGTGCDAANSGCVTFYYTNQQTARLMFYHDHAVGITRLNVYAGMAAGYVLQDPVEQTLATGGTLTNPRTGTSVAVPAGTIPDPVGIPLVIQDKTFVPSAVQLAAQDPTWAWGSGAASGPNGNGDLWWPHVYMPNQNPYDISGANAMGRWDYGPWFWPPFTGLVHGVVPNPYCLPTPGSDCSASPGEPPFVPGTPNPSGTPESFMDTPVVNGKAYPTLTVPAGPVRFRILSVGNDRFLNLSLFVAAAKDGGTTAGDPTASVLCTDNAVVSPDRCTEVKMVPFNSAQNVVTPFPSWWYTIVTNGFTFDDRAGGVPDPGTRGPAMIQIANEGGFLPSPVVIKNQPINYVYNRRDITVGNIKEKALFLGPAERADVIVDFSKFAGKTLLLYNDSPAPVPAADPRLDYYTGNPDNSDTGGAPSTQPGYGPNTRTVMQIVVQGASAGSAIAADDVNPTILSNLQAALPTAFAASQDTVIVPQSAYDQAYGTVTTDVPGTNLATIQSTSLSFAPFGQTTPIVFPMQPKSIIEDFTVDYGRMNALLGVEIPNTNITNQTSIPLSYADPQTEIVKVTDPSMTPIGTAADGTQIWKITHNGVDTHAVHIHMFTVQILNRVGWDGAIRPPDPNELGFKDTIRMNPLEDIILALRPIQLQNVPFKVPNSVRLLEPSAPLGATTSATGMPLFQNVDPFGNPVTPAITNQPVNFGWEYVWHCHILGHEENDMMHALSIVVAPETPLGLAATVSGKNVTLNWTDNSMTATAFTLQRSTDPGFGTVTTFSVPTSGCGSQAGCAMTYSDLNLPGGTYYYRVSAATTVGSGIGTFPTVTAESPFLVSGAVTVAVPPLAPTNLVATATSATSVSLTWNASAGATSYTIQRRTGTGAFAVIATGVTAASYVDNTVAARTTYGYRVMAVNGAGNSPFSNIATVTTPVAAPAAPSNLAAGLVATTSVTLTWRDNANNEQGFYIERSLNGTTWTRIATTGANTTLYRNTGLTTRTTYFYRVQAFNAGGTSAFSNVLTVTTR